MYVCLIVCGFEFFVKGLGIRGTFNKFPDVFVQAFKIFVDS